MKISLLLLPALLALPVAASAAEQEFWNWPIVPDIKLPMDASGKHRTISNTEMRQILNKNRAPFPIISDSRFALIQHEYLGELLDWYGQVATVWGLSSQEMTKRGFLRSRTIRMLRCFAGRAIIRDFPDVEAGVALGMLQVTLKKPWGENRANTTTDFLLVGTDRGWFVVDPVNRLIRPLAPDVNLWRFNLTRF